MGSKSVKRRRLNFEKPWIRKNPRPPKARTLIGESFSTANYQGVLKLQHCDECHAISYPSRERCRACLSDKLVWRDTPNEGVILGVSELHHSQWEFFKRKTKQAPWPIATVLVAGQRLFTHLAAHTFDKLPKGVGLADTLPSGTAIKVFTQSDASYKSVLITVSVHTDVEQVCQRVAIVEQLGLR